MKNRKMIKSNKKSKERKILAATLALAALIVGGSTFAWFTSQDLVTNKLSSKGGLKVIITENFERIDNWTPGVTVTKEVGAINAGNLDAFVRLSLPLTNAGITRLVVEGEVNTSNISIPENAKELSSNEADAMEAGAYLVYAKDEEVTGEKQLIYSGTKYTPTEEGLYIFRRYASSVVDSEDTEYTYEGYVFSNNKYYSVDIEKTGKEYSAKYILKKAGLESPEFDYEYVNKPDSDEKSNYISVTYGTDESSIKIIINLDSTELKNWTFNSVDNKFYYNYVLASGNSTKKLIKSVELEATQGSYYAFDYNLDVQVDAVQIGTLDKDADAGSSIVVPVNAQWKEVEAAYTYGSDKQYNPTSDTNEKVTWTVQTT